MTTEVTYQPTEEDLLRLLKEREWLQQMLEKLVALNDNVERLIEWLPPELPAKGGADA